MTAYHNLTGLRFLVTGGCGLVGSHICQLLNAYNADIVVLDNLSAYPFDYLNYFGVNNLQNVTFIHGSITDIDTVRQAAQSCDYIIHAAAYADVSGGIRNPEIEFKVNVQGTQNVLDVAREINPKKVTFISSASVYGNRRHSDNLFFSENDNLKPVSNYAVSKLWGENQAYVYYKLFNVLTVSLRYFSIYGQPQLPKKKSHSWAIAIFGVNALLNRPIEIYGDGNQVRDFIHVYDVAYATILATLAQNINGMSINLGTGIGRPINDIVNMMADEFDKSVEIKYVPRPNGDPFGGYASTQLMDTLLNWKPKISLADGISSYVAWLISQEKFIRLNYE